MPGVPARRGPRATPSGRAAATRRWSAATSELELARAQASRGRRRARLPARHGRRRGRRRQVAAARRAHRAGRREGDGRCAAAASRTATASRSGRCARSCATRPQIARRRHARGGAREAGGARRATHDVADARRVGDRALGRRRSRCDELFWARAQAARGARPASGRVVVLFDDIHWAEPTFLELIEHVVEHASDAPILVVLCTARHELVERSPDWSTEAGARAARARAARARPTRRPSPSTCSATTGLDRDVRDAHRRGGRGQSALRRAAALDAHRRRRASASRTAPGAQPRRSRDLAIPPTIQALLAARLDRLGREERAVDRAGVGDRPAVRRTRGRASWRPSAFGPSSAAHLATLTRQAAGPAR